MKSVKWHHTNVLCLLASLTLIDISAVASEGGIGWSYAGSNGPSHWGDLASAYVQCKTGMNQSPINIENAIESPLFDLEFNYGVVPLQIVNNGHTIQANYNTTVHSADKTIELGEKKYLLPSATTYNSHLSISGEQYKLLQVHFHSPSEHTINGRSYPMEAHFVHANDQGQLAVVGVLFEYGDTNRFISRLWSNMPHVVDGIHEYSSIQINAEDLLPNDRSYTHYRGSLTTPPCSEGVRWFIMNSTVDVSDLQVSTFLSTISNNARPIQNLNARFLLESE